MKKTVVLLGAGKIGRLVGHFLHHSDDYELRIGDVHRKAVDVMLESLPGTVGFRVDFSQASALDSILEDSWAVLSCAPFHCNPLIAERARALGLHYLDLTEDVAVTHRVEELSRGARTAFIPQCGLAPGFVTVLATHLIEPMSDVSDLRLRVGALPRYPANRLKYNLTWSTDGLINEYCNPCEVLYDGRLTKVQPLENLERLMIDGVEYEAFNTSGGLGSLAETLVGKVRNVNYKSIRYPGHNELLKFLLHDLRMIEHRGLLREIFERSLPTTDQDQIVLFVSATGTYLDRMTERTFARTIHHREIDGKDWSAIQVTTAAAACAVLDLLREGKIPQEGFVRQEQVAYEDFIGNRFGRYYA